MLNTLKSQKGLGLIVIILVIAGILILAGGIYWWQKSKVALEPIPTKSYYKQQMLPVIAYGSSERKATDAMGGLTLSYYFSKDDKDNIYIFSQTTENIRVFDSNGRLKFTFDPLDPVAFVEPATGTIAKEKRKITVDDLVIDRGGNIYIISRITQPMFLYRFSSAGAFQGKIRLDDNVSDKLRKCFDKIYIVDNKIYAKCLTERHINSYLIGKVTNGVLKKTESLLKFRGVLGLASGNWYEVKLVEKDKKGAISVLDSSGSVLRTINLEKKGLASIEFLGEDQGGNIYVQVERFIDSTGAELEVHKFDSRGNRLAIISIPKTGYALSFWSNKLLLLGKNGVIWQVKPADDGWHINKWIPLSGKAN